MIVVAFLGLLGSNHYEESPMLQQLARTSLRDGCRFKEFFVRTGLPTRNPEFLLYSICGTLEANFCGAEQPPVRGTASAVIGS
jgi:hypothetical protein